MAFDNRTKLLVAMVSFSVFAIAEMLAAIFGHSLSLLGEYVI